MPQARRLGRELPTVRCSIVAGSSSKPLTSLVSDASGSMLRFGEICLEPFGRWVIVVAAERVPAVAFPDLETRVENARRLHCAVDLHEDSAMFVARNVQETGAGPDALIASLAWISSNRTSRQDGRAAPKRSPPFQLSRLDDPETRAASSPNDRRPAAEFENQSAGGSRLRKPSPARRAPWPSPHSLCTAPDRLQGFSSTTPPFRKRSPGIGKTKHQPHVFAQPRQRAFSDCRARNQNRLAVWSLAKDVQLERLAVKRPRARVSRS